MAIRFSLRLKGAVASIAEATFFRPETGYTEWKADCHVGLRPPRNDALFEIFISFCIFAFVGGGAFDAPQRHFRHRTTGCRGRQPLQ